MWKENEHANSGFVDMLTYLWRLIVVGFPSKPGVSALRSRVEHCEQLLEQFIDEVKAQRGRIAAALRQKRGVPDENGDSPQSIQDAPQSTNPRAVAYDRPYRTNGGARPSRSNYGG